MIACLPPSPPALIPSHSTHLQSAAHTCDLDSLDLTFAIQLSHGHSPVHGRAGVTTHRTRPSQGSHTRSWSHSYTFEEPLPRSHAKASPRLGHPQNNVTYVFRHVALTCRFTQFSIFVQTKWLTSKTSLFSHVLSPHARLRQLPEPYQT